MIARQAKQATVTLAVFLAAQTALSAPTFYLENEVVLRGGAATVVLGMRGQSEGTIAGFSAQFVLPQGVTLSGLPAAGALIAGEGFTIKAHAVSELLGTSVTVVAYSDTGTLPATEGALLELPIAASPEAVVGSWPLAFSAADNAQSLVRRTRGLASPGPNSVYSNAAVESGATLTVSEASSSDSDGDGIPDDLEAALGLDPNDSDSNNNGVADGDEDFDGDGTSNSDEIQQGSNPAAWVGNVERSGSSANEIDIADVTLLIQRIVGGQTGSLDFPTANVETSGSSASVVDIADVTRLIQYIVSGETEAL